MRYWLQYISPEKSSLIWYDSLGEIYIQLQEKNDKICHVEREDGRAVYHGNELEVKGEIAWVILNIKRELP